jgi:serine/threonine protein phosphatase 1
VNHVPRTLAIGDIHGYLNALETLADFVSLKSDDTLITVGDYVDRGSDSAGVIEWLIWYFDAGQLVPLRGNHDIMMLDALDGGEWKGGWQSFGGDKTLESYRRFGYDPEKDGLPERHRRFIESDCQKIHVTDNHFLCTPTRITTCHLMISQIRRSTGRSGSIRHRMFRGRRWFVVTQLRRMAGR